ncbi:hypothetical protein LSTR_LSTR010073 [Laodelphax striatellus]|uniref:Uncharacterized protein n=1 Tax=Laodelphax striatellus TaxID=195883 RepID=A0A482XH98_LAOST|nr:hypothetical protein LSTR_LSTR010073 [Laodelphax striatellus]
MISAGDNNEVNCGIDGKLTKEKLLNEPYDLNGTTFLALATKLNQNDVVRALLAAGADPNLADNRGLIAFSHATTDQMQQIYLEELLRAIANSE